MIALALAAIAAAAAAQPAPPPDFHAFLQRHFAGDREYGEGSRYASAFVDLNGDRRSEAIIYLMGGHWCGSGGCEMLVFTPQGNSWRQIVNTTVTRTPIRVLNTRTRGWRDLAVTVAGGGIGRSYEALLPFNGRSYPLNPTVAPARHAPAGAPGTVLIRDEDEGRALFN